MQELDNLLTSIEGNSENFPPVNFQLFPEAKSE